MKHLLLLGGFMRLNLFFILSLFLLSSFTYALGSKPPNDGGGGGGGSSEDARWKSMIRKHGGKVVSTNGYSNSASGFRDYMIDSGVEDFSALQIIEPYNSSAARACGLSNLLPEKQWWVRGAALAIWAQKMSRVIGSRPSIRNWYRPKCYNSRVGGASSSDHITARAIDMDFSSSSSRRKAQNWLCQFWNSSLNMQVGLGGNSIHLGAESPHGKRNWYYDSYGDSDRGRTCFDN